MVRVSPRETYIFFFKCTDFISFYFSLRFHTDADDIHNGLLADLITEYFINNSKAAGNIVRWKMHFRKCCHLLYHQDGDILENFCFLEQTGQLAVGKYDILENIFHHVDKRALHNIKDASSKINGLKSMGWKVCCYIIKYCLFTHH